MGDYGTFALMPVSGALASTEDARASTFSHDQELAMASYYRVRLETWKATAEVTPTERAASFRFTFETNRDAWIILEAFAGKALASVEIHPAERKITGVARNVRGTPPTSFGSHFVIVFDQPFVAHGTWTGETAKPGETKLEAAEPMGAFARFDVKPGTAVTCRVASSYISLEQAERNLASEIGAADFDTVRKRAGIALERDARARAGGRRLRRAAPDVLHGALSIPCSSRRNFTSLMRPGNLNIGRPTTARCTPARFIRTAGSGTPSAPSIRC